MDLSPVECWYRVPRPRSYNEESRMKTFLARKGLLDTLVKIGDSEILRYFTDMKDPRVTKIPLLVVYLAFFRSKVCKFASSKTTQLTRWWWRSISIFEREKKRNLHQWWRTVVAIIAESRKSRGHRRFPFWRVFFFLKSQPVQDDRQIKRNKVRDKHGKVSEDLPKILAVLVGNVH